jgi:uncharacterized protein YecE (DUF72 family)
VETQAVGRLFVGLSGFSYKPWQGEDRFYPPELKQAQFFDFYAQRYVGVEMDGTWYRMPAKDAVQKWLDSSPQGFQFCFKAHRQVTHMQRLKPESVPALEFMIERLQPLIDAGKVGCVFLQLPPNLKLYYDRLETLLPRLPKQTRWAIEFRNEAWHTAEVEALLREHRVAWVAADTDEAEAQRRDTGDFVYARMRRSEYDDERLQSWAAWFRQMLDQGKDCYVFFKHEDDGSPWQDADRLLGLLHSPREEAL